MRSQKGFSLAETLVALGVVAAIGMGFVQALGTTSKGTGTYDERSLATTLALSQMEYVKSADYSVTGEYAIGISTPPNYSITLDTVEEQLGRQEVTVNVYHQADFVLKMTTLKVDW